MNCFPFNTLNLKYNLKPYIETTVKGANLCGRHFVVIHSKQTRHENKIVDIYFSGVERNIKAVLKL
jgi:hypothetical protein